ncbi:MAG: RING finger domain-containing protein [Candidatus Hodarchaeota archaeon]
MPSCIICHLNINENTDSFKACKNLHLVHKICIAEWLLHSDNCPLCSEPYPQSLIDQFKDYKDKKEQEKQAVLEKELQEESRKKMQEVADKILFLKFVESIEHLIEEESYNEAIEKLLDLYNENSTDERDLNILYLLGKANYLKGRYDLAINFLFKLVKIRYNYPNGFLYLGKAYERLGLHDKAKWAFDRIKEGI